MNIFYVDSNPQVAAQSLVDRHVVKMILETTQLLSTAHRVLDGVETIEKQYSSGVIKPRLRNVRLYKLNDERDGILYKATHINHPSSIWVRQSAANYDWLYQHLLALSDEYEFRYGKKHKCSSLYDALKNQPLNIPTGSFTQPTPAMDKSFIVSDDSVANYRNYYKNGKSHLFRWTKRNPPSWLE